MKKKPVLPAMPKTINGKPASEATKDLYRKYASMSNLEIANSLNPSKPLK